MTKTQLILNQIKKQINIIFMSLLIIFSIFIASCDKIILSDNTNLKDANYIEKYYNFEDKFENVIIKGDFDIEIINCDSQYVVVDNFIENSYSQIRPIINLKNNNLTITEHQNKIKNKNSKGFVLENCNKLNNNLNNNQQLKIKIFTNKINNLKVIGNSKIYCNNALNLYSMKCFVYGNSYFECSIIANILEIYSNGNSCINLKGKVQNLKMDIVGNEKINFENLNILNSVVKIAGNSNLRLKVEENLKLEIIGNPEIILLNNPKIVESDITGNGFIRK